MYLATLNWNDSTYISNNCHISNKCFNDFFSIVSLSRFRKGQVSRIIKVSTKELLLCESKKIDNLDREASSAPEHSGRISISGRVPTPPPPEMTCPVAENWCYTQVIKSYIYNLYNHIINATVIFDAHKKCNPLKQEYYLEIHELL